MEEKIKELEEYAEKYNIPIIQKRSLTYILKYIQKNNIKTILEIGTAIGYSSIIMALLDRNIKITTIERDSEMYLEAVKNVKNFKLEKQIFIVHSDALNLELTEKYDMVFIDAAKGQYINFFEKYQYNLNEKGVIISDNMSFHDLVESTEEIENKNLRQLVEKIRKYIDFLKNNKDFETKFYKLGDGLAVSEKISE